MNELRKPSAKRILVWVLAIVMCVGLIPADAGLAVKAEEMETTDEGSHQVCFNFPSEFYHYGEENGSTIVSVPHNDTVPSMPAYSSENRNIIGWKELESGTEYDFNQPVTGDLNLYPIFDKYQLVFNSGEAGDLWQEFYVEPGQIFTEVPLLSNEEHYEFVYWYDMMDQETAFEFETTEINQDYFFNAKWKKDFDYRVTFYLAGDFDESTIVQYLDAGSIIEKPEYNNNNGKRKTLDWKEWNSETTYDFSQPVTRDIILYPIYDKYKLEFWGSLDYSIVYADGGELLADDLIPEDDYREHYIFKGWKYWDNETFSEEIFDFTTTRINQDYDFSARFEQDYDYEVEYAGYYGATQYLKEGEKLIPPVSDDEEREIVGWTKVQGSLEKYDITQGVTEDLYLYPIYDKCRLYFEGYEIDDVIYVDTGEYLTDVPQDSRDHYRFFGWEYWNSDEDDYVIFNFETTKITQDYYFEVKWDRDFAYLVWFNYGDDFLNYFWDNEIEVQSEVYLKDGEKPSEPPKYDIGERKILGWTTERGSDQPYDFQEELTEDLDLYPIYDKCRLKFGKEILYVDYGSVVDQAELPTKEKEHYTFRGWGLNSKKLFDFTQPIYRDYTFKAVWKKDFDYLVRFNFGSDFWDYVEENQIVEVHYIKLEESDTIAEPPVYDNDKRKITGWKEWGSNQLFDFSEPISGNVDLYPIYDKCRVTFYDYEGVWNWPQNYYEAYVTPGGKVTAPSQVSDPYFTFKGWKTYDENYDYIDFDFNTPITGDIELEADWEPNFYSVYFYNNLDEENVPYWHGQGRVPKGRPAAGIREQVGDPVVKGHYFAGWYYDEKCTRPFDYNAVLTEDISLYAKWGTNSDGSSITPGNGTETKVTSVTLSVASLTIPKGENRTLTVETAPLKNVAITWTSSDDSVASVSGGVITAKQGGEATVTATAPGGVSAVCKVTVAEVKLNASSAVLKMGTSSTALKIESKYPANDTVAAYESSDSGIVKVNGKGKLTAGKKKGSATITVTMKSGASATCKVTVQKTEVKTKKLTMSVKKLTLKKGKKITLSVKRDPITATEKIEWSTSNSKVATITSKGKLTAKNKGKVTITARTSNGKKATCKITVK